MNLSTAAKVLDASLHGPDAVFTSVESDSRTLHPGALFVALTGPRFDGHDYVSAAASAGAAGALLSRDVDEAIPYLRVDDTRAGLARLAAHWRRRFAIPVVGVTGSSGKTTVKEMIGAALARSGDGVVTRGNLNNEIGVPLTLLRLRESHRFAVIEMGMNHPGEIAYLADIAQPTVALVTNAQRAHLEGMGTIDMIAAEKGSVFERLGPTGVAVINADDEWADLWSGQSAGRQVLRFSVERAADVIGQCHIHGLENRLLMSYRGEQVEVELALPGAHNARNALCAATAALAAGVALPVVREGLAAFRGIKGRLQRRTGLNGASVLDDTYNANPDSVRAGIDVLASIIGKTILVLGDMGEIGDMTGQFHDEIGGYAKSQGIDRMLTLGDSSALAAHNFGAGGQHFRKVDELIEALSAELTPETTVLVKGSRFMRMERVADAICEQTAKGSE